MTAVYTEPPIIQSRAATRATGTTRVGIEPLIYLILLGGIVLRLRLFFGARPLWLDEAMLANNIRLRTLLGLFQPLDNHQGAPIGFLILEKLLWSLFHTDWSLRLVSMASGIATLVMIDRIAKSVLPPAGRVLAGLLAATSLPLIYYSTEVKPYALDGAMALCIVVCALRWARQPTKPNLLALALVGAGAVWFSFPVIFVLGAVGVVLLVDTIAAHDRKAIWSIATIGTVWLISFALVYQATMRHLSHDTSLTDYWKAGFMPYGKSAVGWIARSLISEFRTPGGFQSTKLAAIAALVGAIWLLSKKQRRLALTLILVIVMTLLAATLHRYPFEGRLILFIVPMQILLIAAGAVGFPSRFRAAGVVITLLLSTLLLRQTAQDLPSLFYRGAARDRSSLNHLAELGIPPYEDMVSALNYLKESHEAGHDLYVVDVARPAFEYYGEAQSPDHSTSQPTFFSEDFEVRSVVAQIAAHPRASVLLSHMHMNLDEPALDSRMIRALNATGHKAHEMKFAGCCVICVDERQ